MIKLANHFGRGGTHANADEEQAVAKFCRLLGARVGAERDKRGLKILELSEQLGLSPSYVTLLERGECMPSIRVFLRICSLFNISPNELMEVRQGDGTPQDAEVGENYESACAALNTFTEGELAVIAELLQTFRKFSSKT